MSAIRLARGFTGRDTHREVRGLLPRPRRRAARQGGLGRADARRAGLRAGVPAAIAAATTTLPYNDVAALEACFAQVGRRDRLRHRRAGRRQHGLRAAGAGLPRGAARALHAPRRAADLRRSDDRLPRRARRRAGALRHRAGPHDARQDRRRRHAGRRLRRAARDHGDASRRSGPSTRPARSAAIRSRWRRDSRRSRRVAHPGFHERLAATTTRLVEGLATPRAPPAFPLATNHVCGMFGLFFTRGPVTNYRRGHGAATPRASAASSTACSRRASILRPRPSRRASSPRRTATPRSTRPSKRPAACSRRSRRSADARGARLPRRIFGTLLLAALLAWPAWNAVHAIGRTGPSTASSAGSGSSSCCSPSCSRCGGCGCAGATTGATACRGPFPPAVGAGLGIGVATMLPMSIAMLALGIQSCARSSMRRCSRMRSSAGCSGLVVAVVEETFFRGLMYRAIERESGFAAAAWCTALVYASIHFFARGKIPAAEVAWDSGFRLLGGALANFSNPLAIARLVRHAGAGRPAARAGAPTHRRDRRLHRPAHGLGVGDQVDARGADEDEPAALLVSRFDGYTGWLVAALGPAADPRRALARLARGPRR